MIRRVLTLCVAVLSLTIGSCSDAIVPESVLSEFPYGATTPTCVNPGDIGNYQVKFFADWTATNYPANYPAPLANFTPMIGATHNDDVIFWEPGGISTLGIKNMAELGANKALRNEIYEAMDAGDAFYLIQGDGIGDLPGEVTHNFVVSGAYPLLTFVTMIAPSPDWFIGVGGLDLCEGLFWRASVELDIYAYDAGTDGGADYQSDDTPLEPYQPISMLTDAPFNTGPGATPRPVGKFTITLR